MLSQELYCAAEAPVKNKLNTVQLTPPIIALIYRTTVASTQGNLTAPIAL